MNQERLALLVADLPRFFVFRFFLVVFELGVDLGVIGVNALNALVVTITVASHVHHVLVGEEGKLGLTIRLQPLAMEGKSCNRAGMCHGVEDWVL